jgi:poly(hydroxyalkanoate) granule-associated protein
MASSSKTTKEHAMARKNRSRAGSTRDAGDAAKAARDSAQKIWLAGLGAFERAKTEGPRMFEALVEQGRSMGARAVGMADQALKSMREAGSAGGRWDKLEQVFEDRVSRSLSRLGVLTRGEVDELSRQVRDLNGSLQAFMTGSAGGATRAGPRGKKRRAAAKGTKRAAAKATRRATRKPSKARRKAS